MDKPWTLDTWHSLTLEERWKAVEAYLAACVGWTVKSVEIMPYDYDFALDVDERGGILWVCEHGVLSSPNRPCDRCFEARE